LPRLYRSRILYEYVRILYLKTQLWSITTVMQLKQLDNYLSSISLREKVYLYIMVVVGLMAVSYYTLFASSEKRLQDALRSENELKSKISEYRSYLMFHDEHETILLRRSVEEAEKEVDSFRSSVDYLNYQLQDLSDIVYNREAWSEFLDNITDIAKKSGVELSQLRNTPVDTRKIFDEVLQVEIYFKANFINTILFIDQLECSDLIVDVKAIETVRESGVETVKIPDRRYRLGYRTERVSSEEELLTSSIKLSIWGVK
jgi:hypothetical protein